MLVDNEAHVVTSSISRFANTTWFFKDTYRGKVCIYTFVYVSVCVTGYRKRKMQSVTHVQWHGIRDIKP